MAQKVESSSLSSHPILIKETIMIYADEVQDVDDLTEEQAKAQLKKMIEVLEDLDTQDFFGTEGWIHFFGIDD